MSERGTGDRVAATEAVGVLGYEGRERRVRAGVWRAAGWCVVGQLGTVLGFNVYLGYFWMLVRPAGLIQMVEYSAVMAAAFAGAFCVVRPYARPRKWMIDVMAVGMGIGVAVSWMLVWRVLPIGWLYSSALSFAWRAHVPYMVVRPLGFLFYAFCVCLGILGVYRVTVDRKMMGRVEMGKGAGRVE